MQTRTVYPAKMPILTSPKVKPANAILVISSQTFADHVIRLVSPAVVLNVSSAVSTTPKKS
jgi:hypothetical protein